MKSLSRLRKLALPCLQCVVHDEEKSREEIMLTERNAVLQMQYTSENLDSAQRYASAQLVEVEMERMWSEDVRAHQVQLFEMRSALGSQQVLRDAVCQKDAEMVRWRAKYRNLKDAGRKHVQELHQIHDEEMEAMRKTYLRCNPNMPW